MQLRIRDRIGLSVTPARVAYGRVLGVANLGLAMATDNRYML
jgi:hypothetical protein